LLILRKIIRLSNLNIHIPKNLRESKIFSVIVTDFEGKYSYTNQTFIDRFSFITDSFIGKPFQITIHPDDFEVCNHAAFQLMNGEKTHVKIDVRKPFMEDGEYYWTEWEFSILTNENETPIGILCIGADITKEKRYANKNKEYSKSLAELTESITDGFYQLDENFNFIAANSTAAKTLGKASPDDLIGCNLWQDFPVGKEYKFPVEYKKAMREHVKCIFTEFHEKSNRYYRTTVYPADRGILVFFRDVTEEQLSQKKIEDSELKLSALYNSDSEGNIFIDPKGEILAFNNVSRENLLQFSNLTLKKGKQIDYYLVDSFKSTFYELFNSCLAGNKIEIESALDLPNGPNTYWKFGFKPVYKKNGEIFGVSFITRNISERKKLEDNKKANQELFDAINESTNELLVILSLSGNVLFANQKARSFAYSNYKISLESSNSFFSYFNNQETKKIKEIFDKAILGQPTSFTAPLNNKYFSANIFPVKNTEKVIKAIALTAKDVTLEKIAEQKLKESEEKFKKIIDLAPNPILMVNELLNITLINKAFEEVIQYNKLEVSKIGFLDLIPDFIQKNSEFLNKNLFNLKGLKFIGRDTSVYIKKKNGSEIQVEVSLNLIEIEGKKQVIIILQDLSELVTSLKKLQFQNDTLQEIAWMQSHIVRTPVANILGLADLLTNHLTNESKEVQNDYLKKIAAETIKLDEIIQQIVAKTKLIDRNN
jgi:PAS domain S-box-containing protein